MDETETPGQCRARLSEVTTSLGAARAQVARLINGLRLPQLDEISEGNDDEDSGHYRPCND